MKLGVLIPAYRAHQSLPRTLASLAADPAPFDVVVVDDGSEPPLEVPTHAGAHDIVLLRLEKNGGIARALNHGLRWMRERGYDLVARLDAGDINGPSRLSSQVAFLDRHPDVALVGSWTRHVDEQMTPLYVTQFPTDHASILARFHTCSPFSHPTCLFRMAAVEDVGGYDERYELGEDYELFWRMAARHGCANLPEALVTRVETRSSLTYQRRWPMALRRLRLQWRHFEWRQASCWFGLLRSLLLLPVPKASIGMLKRAIGVVG